jgi:outer membrane protein
MKIKTLLLFLIVLGVPFFAAAQTSLKIGHVNVQELVQKHPQMDSIRTIMDQESKDMQEIYDEMIAEHEQKLATFEAESETYSDFVKEAKQNELLELVQKIQNYNATAQQQMQKRNMELVQPLYQQINQAISSVAGTDNFTYVLDVSNGAVAYVSPTSSDITVRVLEELQK